MNRKIEALQHQALEQADTSDFCVRPPFIMEILWEPLPVGFKMPHLKAYDGSTNPTNHLESFRTLILLQEVNDAILC